MNPEVNETQPEETQDGVPLSTDELAAAMGFMTTLGDQQIMAEQEQIEGQNEELENEEAEVETEQIDPEQMKSDLMKDVKSLIKEEIGGLKEMLKEALQDDEPKEE